jgi:glycerol-3-phosphate acyltransferase PlsX
MNIALDMMGGDFAPLEAVKGLAEFLMDDSSGTILFLIGDEEKINPLLQEFAVTDSRIRVIHAPEVIGMHEHPTKALKEKQRSSIAVGFRLLATGKTDAFISAGNTGAMLAGALFSPKAL